MFYKLGLVFCPGFRLTDPSGEVLQFKAKSSKLRSRMQIGESGRGDSEAQSKERVKVKTTEQQIRRMG